VVQLFDRTSDIANATYDLEDALKGGFVTPLALVSMDESSLEAVAAAVSDELGREFAVEDALQEILAIFGRVISSTKLQGALSEAKEAGTGLGLAEASWAEVHDTRETHRVSCALSASGFLRTALTTELVGDVVRDVSFELDSDCPPVSRVTLLGDTRLRIVVLKTLIQKAVTLSPRLRIADYRGEKIMQTLIDELRGEGGANLLPSDFRDLYDRYGSAAKKKRVICDFLAGMTDSHARELYSSLTTAGEYTVFRPRE